MNQNRRRIEIVVLEPEVGIVSEFVAKALDKICGSRIQRWLLGKEILVSGQVGWTGDLEQVVHGLNLLQILGAGGTDWNLYKKKGTFI